MTNPLSIAPPRQDLTDRECAKLLAWILGSLRAMTDLASLRNAVAWWHEHDEAWALLERIHEVSETASRIVLKRDHSDS